MENTNIDFNSLTIEQICQLINNTLSGNNQKITQATKILKLYVKHKSSIKILTQILINSQNISQRQMSTILLKRNIVNLYMGLTSQEQNQFKHIILQQYIRQPSIVVQRGIAILISLLLPVIQLKNWIQLQQLLDQALKSAPNNIATFILLNCLLYHFKPPKQLYPYLFKSLEISNLQDQVIKCIITVSQTQQIDQNFAIQLIKIWQKSNWDQDISLKCLEVLNTMAQRKIKLSEQIIQWICNHIISNKKLSTKFRVSGLDFLSSFIEFNSKYISNKQKLLKKIIETVSQVCSQPFGQQQLEQGQPVQQIALWLIQTLSISLKSKKVYPILLQTVTNLINSNDIHKNNTGYLLLGSMAQGCSQKLKKNLQNPIMNVLIPKGLSHPAPQVRGAAINTLTYFSQYLIPDIVYYHSTIIPSLIGYIDDMSTKVAEKALIAIDIFFQNLQQDQIIHYLSVVIPKLSQVVISNKSTIKMRNISMSAIGTAVQASQLSFQPYVQNIYKMCIQILKIQQSPQFNTIRSQNIQVIGKICNIFCKNTYKNYKQFYQHYTIPIMQPIYNILTTQTDPQIRQSCFMFFYLIANAIQIQFNPIFDKIIVQVLKSAKLISKLQKQSKNKQQFSLDSDSQQEYITQIHASQYDQKSSAIHALGQLANACPIKFIPYYQQSYKILQNNHQFFYDPVRSQVSTCYINLLKGYIKSQNNGILPQYQYGLPVLHRYPQNIQKFMKNQILAKLLMIITEDQNNRVKSVTIQALNQYVRTFGPASIDHSIQKITQTIIQLLQSQVAQSDSDQDQLEGQQQQQEQDDTDAYIFQPLCGDLIPSLAQILRGAFLPYLTEIFPYMSKFLIQRQNINDNIQIMGCISQCIKYVPSFYENNNQQLFQNMIKLLQLNNTDLNRNIAYCIAQALEKASSIMKNYIQHSLYILKNIYDNSNSHQACKDNALAGICKAIIVYNPPMPYQQFISQLIKSMPFQGDQTQEITAIRCIIHLSHINPNLIKPYAQQLITILQHDLLEPKKYHIQGDMINIVTNYLNALKTIQ